MANNAWDREIINNMERPLSSDINTAQSQLDRSVRDFLAQLFAGRVLGSSDLAANPISGFVGDALKVRAPASPGLSVQIAPGIGWQYAPGDAVSSVGSISGLDDLSVYKPLPLLASVTLTGITAGPAALQDRYDIIEVRTNRVATNSTSRQTFDPGSRTFTTGLVNKTLAFTLDGSTGQVNSPASSTAAISYKVGVAAATGAAAEPATTTGYVKIATIFSNNGNMTAGITKANIIDRRQLLTPYQQVVVHVSGSVPSGAATAPTVVTVNAPPGVEVLVTKNAQPAQNRFKLYIIGGLGLATTRVAASAEVLAAYSASSFNKLTLVAATSGALDSTAVTALADATLTSNAQTLAVGTPFVSCEFAGNNQASGATSASVPDPMSFNAIVHLTHY